DVAVTGARLVGLAALATLAAAMLVRAWRRVAQPAQVVLAAGVTLAGVALLGPVVSPSSALVPLAGRAAVVAPRAVDGEPPAGADRWLAVATLVFAALVLPSGLGVPVVTKLPGAVAVTLAVAGWGWWVWRRRPAGWPHRWLGRPRGPAAPGG